MGDENSTALKEGGEFYTSSLFQGKGVSREGEILSLRCRGKFEWNKGSVYHVVGGDRREAIVREHSRQMDGRSQKIHPKYLRKRKLLTQKWEVMLIPSQYASDFVKKGKN